MDDKAREPEEKTGGNDEDVIPSSQGEMFSSQSSTPDLLSASHVIPILQPSQSISGTESDTPQELRAAELLASTPSTFGPGVPVSPAAVRFDLSDSPSDVQPDPASPTALLKRPHADDPETSPPDKRPRSAASVALDDSDVQFVEEVAPDVQVVFSSQERGSAAVAAVTADSQAGFRLSLSESQLTEVASPPPAEAGPGTDPSAERATDARAELRQSPVDVLSGAPADLVADPGVLRAVTASEKPTEPSGPQLPTEGSGFQPPAEPSGPQPLAESNPHPPSELSNSQPSSEPSNPQPPAEPSVSQPPAEPSNPQPVAESGVETTESTVTRFPHIQTPQVGSSSDSASPPTAETVFGHAQRMIEEQNRRQELRDRQAAATLPQEALHLITVEPEEEPVPVDPGLKEPVPTDAEQKESGPTDAGLEPARTDAGQEPVPTDVGQKEPGRTDAGQEPVPTDGAQKELAPTDGGQRELAPTDAEQKEPVSVTLEAESAPVAIEMRKPAPAAEEPTECQNGTTPSAEERDVESQPRQEKDEKVADENQQDSQTSGFSQVADWHSFLKSPGQTAEVPGDRQRYADGTGHRTETEAGTGVAAAATTVEQVSPHTAVVAAPAASQNPPGLVEEPLPSDDPYRFHSTQSQETQPYRLRLPPIEKKTKVLDKTTSTEGASPPSDLDDPSFQRLMKSILAESTKLSNDGACLSEMRLVWRKDNKELVKAYSLDGHSGAMLRLLASSLLSSSGSGSSAGYAGDVSGSTKSSDGSVQQLNKRHSTLSSVTLSTIEGRGARHSVSSSVEAAPFRASRRSVVSVHTDSPGSDADVQVLSPPPSLAPVPEFISPDRRPPLPHGQPSAVSSLRSEQPSELWSASQWQPPAATSTQRELQRAAPSSQASSSSTSHVTGSSDRSLEVALQPPLPAGPGEPRPLTDREEEELSDREQSELPRRTLEPGCPCFALWGADKTYYPGRLVSLRRADRWLVRFDDGTERQVPTEHLLPVVNLWKGLSVFVQMNQRNVYEAGIITGHRMRPGDEPLEYIVSMDSHPDVTSAVPRSWLSLTRDQAALIRERRQPSLGQLAVGSPSRHLSLDNLVTGRRRAAGAGGGRRLANFEPSCSDVTAAEDAPAADPPTPASSRRRAQSSGSRRGRRAAAQPVSPSGAGIRGSAAQCLSRSGRTSAAEDAAASGTPGSGGRRLVTASTPTDESATPGGRRKTRNTPARKAGVVRVSEPTASPSGRGGRGKKRAAESDTSPGQEPTPGRRGSTRVAGSSPGQEPTPGRRGSARAAGSSLGQEPTPARRGSARAAGSSLGQEPTPARRGFARQRPVSAATSGDGRSRKRLALTPATENMSTDDLTDNGNEEETTPIQLGDVPDTKTRLFAKHTFILSCVDLASAATPHKPWKRPRFDKEHVRRHIEAHGGHVLESAVLTPAAIQRVRRQGDVLLISNGPLRTTNYISCLAMGVPCVQLSWLQNSIRLKHCLPYEDYLLPAGQDPETGDCVEQMLGAMPPPLQRLRVLLVAETDSEWGQHMKQILSAAGAKVKQDNRDPAAVEQSFPLDVVVAEADCPPTVLVWARQCGTPVVSGEWVVDSVVAHRRLDFTERPQFDHRGRQP